MGPCRVYSPIHRQKPGKEDVVIAHVLVFMMQRLSVIKKNCNSASAQAVFLGSDPTAMLAASGLP